MKTMTREQAEKAAMEFANKKIKNGCFVQKERKRDIFYVYYAFNLSSGFKRKSFQFTDLVPGDACLVWDDDIELIKLAMFFREDSNGVLHFGFYKNRIESTDAGDPWENYRKLGFNVLEIEKGWREDDAGRCTKNSKVEQ